MTKGVRSGGVYFDADSSKWFARPYVKGVRRYLGQYDTKAEAESAVQFFRDNPESRTFRKITVQRDETHQDIRLFQLNFKRSTRATAADWGRLSRKPEAWNRFAKENHRKIREAYS